MFARRAIGSLLALGLWLLPLAVLRAGSGIGPVPETEHTHLFVHAIGRDFLPGTVLGRAQMLSDGYTGKGYENPNLGWLRDRFPLQMRTREGRLAVVAYLSLLNASGYPFDASTSMPVPPPPNLPPGSRPYKVKDGVHWMEVRKLPLLLEGGNLIPADGWLFIGEKALARNQRSPGDLLRELGSRPKVRRIVQGLTANGYRKRSPEETLAELSRAFEIPREQVVVLPWMPGERTGHPDMWMATLGPKTLAVATIPDEIISSLGMDHEHEFARSIRGWLDDRAAHLASATRGDFEIVRVPMLAPKNLKRSDLSPLGWDAEFPSTLNWVLHRGTALIPRFPRFLGFLSEDLRTRFENEVSTKLKRFGYEVEWVDSSRVLRHNGLVHCLTGTLAMESNNPQ